MELASQRGKKLETAQVCSLAANRSTGRDRDSRVQLWLDKDMALEWGWMLAEADRMWREKFQLLEAVLSLFVGSMSSMQRASAIESGRMQGSDGASSLSSRSLADNYA